MTADQKWGLWLIFGSGMGTIRIWWDDSIFHTDIHVSGLLRESKLDRLPPC